MYCCTGCVKGHIFQLWVAKHKQIFNFIRRCVNEKFQSGLLVAMEPRGCKVEKIPENTHSGTPNFGLAQGAILPKIIRVQRIQLLSLQLAHFINLQKWGTKSGSLLRCHREASVASVGVHPWFHTQISWASEKHRAGRHLGLPPLPGKIPVRAGRSGGNFLSLSAGADVTSKSITIYCSLTGWPVEFVTCMKRGANLNTGGLASPTPHNWPHDTVHAHHLIGNAQTFGGNTSSNILLGGGRRDLSP